MSSVPTPPYLRQSPILAVAPPTTARLTALYASTSAQKLTNPTGYAANLKWWTGLVEDLLRTGWIGNDRLVLRVDDNLLDKLSAGDGSRPKGMGGVIDSQATTASPALHPLGHFLSSPIPLHAPGSLTYRLVGRPLYWAFSQLNPFGSSSSGEVVEKEEVLWKRYAGKEFVHIPLLEAAADAVSAYLEENPIVNYSSSLFSPTSFRQQFGRIAVPAPSSGKKVLPEGEHRLSEKDVEVLIKWLSRDRGMIVSDGEVIKILEPGQKAADHPISEADRGTLTILQTLSKISDQIDAISAQITQYQSKAKSQLASNQKSLALSSLRSKKQLEELLDKRLATSHQLTQVLSSIDQSKSDIEIMESYQTATSTLKGILSHPSLSIERVEKTTEELAEIMADSEEVNTAIRDGGKIAVSAVGVVVDDDELAEELEQLVLEEKERSRAEAESKVKETERKAKDEEERTAREEKKAKEHRQKTSTDPGTKDQEGEWQKRYDEANDRRREEAQRFEAERARKEAQRVAAE